MAATSNDTSSCASSGWSASHASALVLGRVEGPGGKLFVGEVAERLERAPVDLARADGAHDRRVAGRDVADMRREAVLREERVEPAHRAVAHDLRDDRRGRDR